MESRNMRAVQKINYGVYLVASRNNGKFNGQIVNTVFQVTSEPQTVAVCINKTNLTCDYIAASKVFSVSILDKDAPMTFIGTWGFKSGRDIDKFANVKSKQGVTGAPVALDWAVGWFECEVISLTDVGTHCIFVGKVINDEVLDASKEPLTYEYYRLVKKGKSPASAPTYVKPEAVKNGQI